MLRFLIPFIQKCFLSQNRPGLMPKYRIFNSDCDGLFPSFHLYLNLNLNRKEIIFSTAQSSERSLYSPLDSPALVTLSVYWMMVWFHQLSRK